MPQESDPRRYYELDSLRGLAALTVVFLHFSRICSPRVIHIFDNTPLRLLVAGHAAVILFFLLSGLVLTLPYKKNGRLDYGPFVLKRVCRIYLPYLGALAFAILCDLHFSSRNSFENSWTQLTWSAPVTTSLVVQHILFLGNYDWSQFNTAFWSLVYEMRVSLVFPFLALAVLRLRAVWVILSEAALSVVCYALAFLFSTILHLSSRSAAISSMRTLHYAAFFLIGSLWRSIFTRSAGGLPGSLCFRRPPSLSSPWLSTVFPMPAASSSAFTFLAICTTGAPPPAQPCSSSLP